MKITALGTGSPESTPRRASSGYLVEIGSDRILLDCGGGIVDRLIRSGRMPGDITHLFFSHLHSDHMMDYARLVHAAWDEGGAELRVFGPAPIATIHERLFGPDGAFAFDLTARTELPPSQKVWLARGGTLPRPWPNPPITEIEAGYSYRTDHWTLTSCEVFHAQPLLDCMGFRIDAGGRSFVFSGDAGLDPGFETFAADADLLIHWCYRFDDEPMPDEWAHLSPTPSQLGAMAKRAGVRDLRLTHIRTHNDTAERLAMARAAVQAGFGPGASILEDGEVIDLGSVQA